MELGLLLQKSSPNLCYKYQYVRKKYLKFFIFAYIKPYNMFDCYDLVVGLSNTDCECTAANRPTDYNVSKSGLFLDGLSSVNRLVGLVNCDKTVWDILAQARADGTTQFVADTNALLGKRFKQRRKVARDQFIGQIKHKDTYTNSKNYAVVTLSCAPVRSGFMDLKKIGSTFTGVGTIQVELHNNIDGLLNTFELVTIANKHVSVAVNLQLPLHSKYVRPLEYFLVYQFDGSNLPKDTKIDCGCGTLTPIFDKNTPYYSFVGASKNMPWTDYVMVGGREINSLSELEDEITTMSSNLFGLSVEADFSCKVDEVLCGGSLDFIGNPLALSMALAIQYAGGIKVAHAVLKSPLLNRENMIGADDWEQDILDWQEAYNENVNYIVAQADYTANDCLSCKSVYGLARGGLFA